MPFHDWQKFVAWLSPEARESLSVAQTAQLMKSWRAAQ